MYMPYGNVLSYKMLSASRIIEVGKNGRREQHAGNLVSEGDHPRLEIAIRFQESITGASPQPVDWPKGEQPMDRAADERSGFCHVAIPILFMMGIGYGYFLRYWGRRNSKGERPPR